MSQLDILAGASVALTGLRHEVRLILRDRRLVVLSMLVPLAVISIIAAALLGDDGGPRVTVALVDEDRGPVARDLAGALAEHLTVVELPRDEAVRFVRDRHDGPVAVVLPDGLSDRYRHGRSSEILLLSDPAQEDGLRAAKLLLQLMEKRAAALNDPLATPLIALHEENLTGNRLSVTPFEQNLPGFCLLFVLLAVVFSTSLSLHDERDFGTWPRLAMAPAGLTPILLGKLAARFLLGVAQLLIMLAWSRVVFGVSLGASPAGMVLVAAAVALATVGTGALLAAATRTRAQVQPLGLALVILLSGLGGLWWPAAMTPAWLQAVSPAAYTTWAMRGLNDLILRGRGLEAVLAPVVAMTVYALLAGGIGLAVLSARRTWR